MRYCVIVLLVSVLGCGQPGGVPAPPPPPAPLPVGSAPGTIDLEDGSRAFAGYAPGDSVAVVGELEAVVSLDDVAADARPRNEWTWSAHMAGPGVKVVVRLKPGEPFRPLRPVRAMIRATYAGEAAGVYSLRDGVIVEPKP